MITKINMQSFLFNIFMIDRLKKIATVICAIFKFYINQISIISKAMFYF